MNKITKIFDNIGANCSVENNSFVLLNNIAGYQTLDQSSVGYYIPYLVRNTKDNYKWEIGVGEVKYNNGSIVVERYEIESSSNNKQPVSFTGNSNEFYLFVNNTNFNSSFNNVIVKHDHFSIDNISAIYLVDTSNSNIDCLLPEANQSRNITVDLKALSSDHNIIIRDSNGNIFGSSNTSTRLVCDGQSWYILDSNDISTQTLRAQSDEYSILSTPGGNPYSFQINNGSTGLDGTNVYWGSGNSNKILLGSNSENNAHSIIPTSGSDSVIFNKDYQASDFIVYGSGQPYRNLFFSYDGRVGINIPSGSRPQTIFHVVNYSCSEILRLENRTSCQPAKFTIYHKPSSINNGDKCSIINLAGRDTNNNQVDYANIYSIASDTVKKDGGLVLSVSSSGLSQATLFSGTADALRLGNNNNKITISGSELDARATNRLSVGASTSSISFNTNGISINSPNLSLGTGSITSNGTISVENLSASSITLSNIAPSSLLTLSSDNRIVPVSGISISNSTNRLVLNNISGNRFLTTDNNNNVVGSYSLDDFFLTEKDIVWNKYNPRSCSVCLKQVTFVSPVDAQEFSEGDQVEITIGSNTLYRTISDITLNNNVITELLLNQNVTTNTVDNITIVSITRGGYLVMQKNVTDTISDSTSNVLSIRPGVDTSFNTGQKSIDFTVYGTNTTPALKIHSSVGSKSRLSGIYYSYATKNNSMAAVPINVGGSGINNNFSSANYNYNTSNNLFSGIVSTVGSNGLPSYYGTYDQNGNVAEWIEDSPSLLASNGEQYAAGGSYQTKDATYLKSIELGNMVSGYSHIGFRVASISNIIDISKISSSTNLNYSFVSITGTFNTPDTGSIYVRSIDNIDNYNQTDIRNLGVVNNNYRMSIFETTNAQYAYYLNSVATGNNFTSSGLYDTRMSSENTGGILRNLNGLYFNYTTKPNMANKPVTFISYINALRYINWLNNGALSGSDFSNKTVEETLDDGPYSLLRDGSNYIINYNKENRKYFLPDIHQWHKAAYFQPQPAVLVSGKPAITINTPAPHIVATESVSGTVVPKQLIADLTVSGWLVVDKIIVRDGTIRSSLSDIGFTPATNTNVSTQTVPGRRPPRRNETGGSASDTYWSDPTASSRRDGVYGEIAPPLPPDGNGTEIDCDNSPELVEANNLPYWCRPDGRNIGPIFY